MSETPFLQKLSQREPWRRNIVPKNALDPAWTLAEQQSPCDGEIRFEGTSRWWHCTKCGYIGSSFTNHHEAARHPVPFFLTSVMMFVRRRLSPPTPLQTVVHQLLYITGVALRYASARDADSLSQYVEQLSE